MEAVPFIRDHPHAIDLIRCEDSNTDAMVA